MNFLYRFFFLFLISFLISCSSSRDDEFNDRIKPNCGEIVRLWSQNTDFSDGNPCGNNDDYSRRFTIQVKNQITGNIKNFCVNTSVFIRYSLGDKYCDEYDPLGW